LSSFIQAQSLDGYVKIDNISNWQKHILSNLQVNNGEAPIVNPIGSTLGERYQILEQLGESNLVTTYLAIDLQVPGNLQLKCAIHRYQSATTTTDIDWDQAALAAQQLYDLSRQVDRLPIVYSYFVHEQAFYIVREFVEGSPLAQELLPCEPIELIDARQLNRSWSQSQVIRLLVDLLEVLHDIDRCDAIPEPICLAQIVRRHLDGKLILLNLPIEIDATPRSTTDSLPLTWHNLRMIGEIAIAAAIGIPGADLPLTVNQRSQWQQLATQIGQPEAIKILDRLITSKPADRYPSIVAAWQAVARVIPQLLIHQHSRTETQAEIANHVKLVVDRGSGFYEIGNCQQAISAYNRALDLDDQCVEAYCGRGNALRYLGEYSRSGADFDTALKLNPDCGIAYIGRALANTFEHHSEVSPTADFEQGKNLLDQPITAIEYLMRGSAKAQLHDAQGAMADYNQAIKLNPRLVVAYNNRGSLRQSSGDVDGALTDFSAVLWIDSQSATAYNNRAIIYTQIGRLEEAVSDYQRAIELEPDFVSVYNNLGNAYCQMGKSTEAIAQYSRAIEFDPEFAVAYSNRANVHRIIHDFGSALGDYDQAIELDPKLVIAYYNRGICHRQVGNHQAAIDDYTQTLTLDPQYFYAYYHRGNARQYLGDHRGAIADYTHTICYDPDHLHAHYNRAITRSQINDIQGAMEDLDRAIELSPEFSRAYYQRGWLLATHSAHTEAITQYDHAIQLNPNYRDAYYQRGCSHQSLGNLATATTDFNHSIDIDAKYAPAYYQRGNISVHRGDRLGAISDYHQAANLYLDRGDSQTYQQIVQILDRLA
jgi:tetratricopeptide (TPR) repeat protein